VTRARRRRRTPAPTAGQLSLPPPRRRRLRLPPRVVTVDLDATLYDPWACHGYAGDHRSSDGCTHVRQDTLEAVRELCARTAVQPVVLSWRSGLLAVSRAWLEEIGLEVAALLIPGAPDDLTAPRRHLGQVAFKEATVRSLLGAGVEVVASFDDNPTVLAALQVAGVPDVRLVPHPRRHRSLGMVRGVPRRSPLCRHCPTGPRRMGERCASPPRSGRMARG
jgi:hypothetical protein